MSETIFDGLTKNQIIERTSRIKKNEIPKLLTSTTVSNTQKNRLKYLGYLYSELVDRQHVIELHQNTEFIARYWEELKKMLMDINIEEFDQYPEIVKYYETWCNSIQGESILYTVGGGNIEHGKKKYGKRLFKKYELDVKLDEHYNKQPTQPSPIPTIELNDEDLQQFIDLASVGFKGFYMQLAAITPNNKTPVIIVFDNRKYPDVVYTPEEAEQIRNKILYLLVSGQLQITPNMGNVSVMGSIQQPRGNNNGNSP